jgi:tetratricopeptide (TPR) repeat protein
MTAIKKPIAHSHQSTRHFLFSKTDTDRIKKIQEKQSLDAVRSVFPDLRHGDEFIEHANSQLADADKFCAMVIRPDRKSSAKKPPDPSRAETEFADIAGILNGQCLDKNGLWGSLNSGALGCFLPGINEDEGLELAGDIQKRVAADTSVTVSIGLALFPTLTFLTPDILENAGKALDHAAFFGANSLVAFDDVSLNISGDKLYEKGKIQAAVKEFKLALKLNPGNVNVHNSLGVCYGLQRQYDAATAEFQKATALEPDEYMALYNLGLVHLLVEQEDRALECFLGADKINGNNYEVTFQTGRLYLKRGNLEKCRSYLQRAAKLEPESGQIYRYLGDCWAAAHDPAAAVSAYKKAIKHNPHDAAALSALGSIFDDQGENPDITLMFLRESIELSPNNGLYHHRLGQYFSKRNNLDDALKEFVTAGSLGYEATADIKAIKNRKKAEK